MAQLRRSKILQELDLRIKVVAFDQMELARSYVKEFNLDVPMLLDPDRQLYNDYGLLRGSWWALYGPVSIWKYLQLMFRGRPPGKPGKDWRQLGGNILIDPTGVVRMHHVSASPHHRPRAVELATIIQHNT